ncbi:CBASS cGAMP-activated phospholipase [Gelidibacter salicanalis]|uniref:Patatin-like phospholipase family protein n=1 Tax=Gelidibacter salicanalis TaxID=291193 RepID=A0A934NJT0_9FLAO|nr:CBASS cGAMP-activated phospholipase [Gelidibacter salicanalis]MBJ7881864.1 patatin-like phospholipase family protein [Gelidibacter salicanalis]
MNNEKFKILSIDGGGIKGVFPAYYLSLIEQELAKRNDGKTKIKDHFQLITGTSTGGIIALALSLGIPAQEIYELYIENADKIFRKTKYSKLGKIYSFFRQIFWATHKREVLEDLVRNKFKEYFQGDDDPRLNDCLTHVAIPIYDMIKGNPSVLKSPYHPSFKRDLHIPAYKAAMATSAAPTYFDPYSSEYLDLDGMHRPFNNKVDGGIMANNPTLIGVIEGLKAFGKDLKDLEVLSIGTGYKKFTEGDSERKKWGLYYWMVKNGRKRLIDLFMQSQSQLVENYISLLHQGIDKTEIDNPNFVYDRINVILCEDDYIEMDEKRPQRIKNFAELAMVEFHEKGSHILKSHFY